MRKTVIAVLALGAVGTLAGVAYLRTVAPAEAFQGPSSSPGVGSGVVLIDGSGNLVVGTSTTNGARLTVGASADSLRSLARESASYPTTFRVGTDSGFVVNSGNADTLILKNGSLGINTDPAVKLHVADSGTELARFERTGGQGGIVKIYS